MITCDPKVLADAAKCFSCLDARTLVEISTDLICRWVDGQQPVVGNFRIIQTGEIRSTNTGDLRIYS